MSHTPSLQRLIASVCDHVCVTVTLRLCNWLCVCLSVCVTVAVCVSVQLYLWVCVCDHVYVTVCESGDCPVRSCVWHDAMRNPLYASLHLHTCALQLWYLATLVLECPEVSYALQRPRDWCFDCGTYLNTFRQTCAAVESRPAKRLNSA